MRSKTMLFSEQFQSVLQLEEDCLLQPDSISEDKLDDFLTQHKSHFQQIKPLYGLLNTGVNHHNQAILQWIETHCLDVLKQIPPTYIKESLGTAWDKGFLVAVDFLHKHFSHSLTASLYFKNHIYFRPCGGVKKTFNYAETAVYFTLVKKQGWESAFKIRQTQWKEYLEKEVSTEFAVELTEADWKRGSAEAIRFCYEHFRKQLFTSNKPHRARIEGRWIIQTVLARNHFAPEFLMEAFLKSGLTEFVCTSNLELYFIAPFLENYLLLQECTYTEPLATRYEDFKKTMDSEKESHRLFHSVETSIQRNRDIHRCHRIFLTLCNCMTVLKTNLLPELTLKIVLFMLESAEIKPVLIRSVFGFFKDYEIQVFQSQEYAESSVQPSERSSNSSQLSFILDI